MLTVGHVTHYGGGLEVHQVSYPVDQKEHDFLPTDVHKPLTFIFSVFVWLETPFKTPNKILKTSSFTNHSGNLWSDLLSSKRV